MTAHLEIVRDGKTRLRLIIGKRAHEPVVFAADEVSRYVHEMTGVKLPIVRLTRDAAELCLEPIGHRGAKAGPRQDSRTANHDGDASRIIVTTAGACIRGGSGRAVLYGAYDLLEQLGCGFCVPGEDTVPRKRSLTLRAGDRQVSPAFTYRGQLDFPLGSIQRSEILIDWLAKNRLNWYHAGANASTLPVERRRRQSNGSSERWTVRRGAVCDALKQRGLRLHFGGHTMMTWLSDEYFDAHPEWFALIDGKRGALDSVRHRPLCVTNQAMHRQLVRNMRRFLDENPQAEILDLWHPDSDAFCHCPQCLCGVSGDHGDEFVGMAYLRSFVTFSNAVAEQLQRTHPHVRVSPLVNYSQSTNWPLPAQLEITDNVLVGLAHFPPLRDSYLPLAGDPHSEGNTRLLGIDLSWKAKAKRTYLYEYYNSWYMPFIHPQALLAGRDLKLLSALGFNGLSSDMWGWTPVNLYVVARLMWDPSCSARALVKDFCRRYYVKAADPMFEYWMGLEELFQGIPGYLSSEQAMATCRKARRRWVSYLKDVASDVSDPILRSRIERCLLPWRNLGDRNKARWWAVPAFNEDDSSPN